ncbi:MAG: hypothetical protein KAY37_13275 [Phycisphaerae bacterium]|nr:hypothetical protein [Phycisphaerae bacterium]
MLERIGIVGFFGVLVPGSYLASSICIAILAICSGSPETLGENTKVLLETGTVVVTSAFLLFAYLLGMLLRLIGPDRIDWLSAFWFRRILRKPVNRRNLWMFERFPYRHSLENALKRAGMSKVIEVMRKLNAQYALPGNTPFFNYCKIFIEGNSPEISRQVQHAEATVRFLAGSVLALALSFVVWVPVAAALISPFGVAPLLVPPANLAFVLLIVHRFKQQRRKEVFLVWCAMYLLLNQGIPAKAPEKAISLSERVSGS